MCVCSMVCVQCAGSPGPNSLRLFEPCYLWPALCDPHSNASSSYQPPPPARSHLSLVIWALAKVGPDTLDAAWLARFYDKTGCVLRSADAHSLSLTAWSLASLGLRPPPALLEALCGAAARRFHTSSGQSLANTVWAVAKMRYQPGAAWCDRYEWGVWGKGRGVQVWEGRRGREEQRGGTGERGGVCWVKGGPLVPD